MGPKTCVVLLVAALVAAPALAAEAPAAGAQPDKPRIMLVPEFDADMLGPAEPRAAVRQPLPGLPVTRLKDTPAKCFLLVRTLLTRELLKKRYRLVDPRVAERVSSVYTRLREFRTPSAASGGIDSVAQRIAYQHQAEVLCFYKLLIHKAADDRDVRGVKGVRDSVQVRLVSAASGRLLAMDERTSAGISDADEYLAHRMAIERILLTGTRPGEKGLAAFLMEELETWWKSYLVNGRPAIVSFYIQGEDASAVTKLASLLASATMLHVFWPPRPRRIINSEATKEIFAEYEISFVGNMYSLQSTLVEQAAKVPIADGLTLADKYRITIDAFSDHVTLCCLDPSRPEVREGVGVVPGAGAAGGPAAAAQALAAAARRATVMVRTFGQQGDALKVIGSGSGAVLTPDGKVVTNHHVTAKGRKFYVEFESTAAGGNPQYEAELVRSMPDRDLALLQIKLLRPGDTQFPFLRLGKSAELRVGDRVAAIGAPFNAELINNVTFGTVSALGRTKHKLIVHTAPIYSGNSGGPLLNMRGEVVGINTAGMTGRVTGTTPAGGGTTIGRTIVTGFSMAIPAELVAELLR